MVDEELEQLEERELSLLETLDHVLNRGLVIAGEITISVADIDLIFLGLNVLLSSVETAHEVLGGREGRDLALRQDAPGAGRNPESAGEDG
ncbi:MAG TPA: gas vesicle protein [Pyrinomonadaceae bacterium]|nr:gas vesicle protein [Pyrinomonadaceae bacterium]